MRRQWQRMKGVLSKFQEMAKDREDRCAAVHGIAVTHNLVTQQLLNSYWTQYNAYHLPFVWITGICFPSQYFLGSISYSVHKGTIFFPLKPSFKWSRSVTSDSLWPHGQQPTRLLCPLDFPGKNTGVGCHFLLQIFPTQGLNPGLLHCRQILYHLSHQPSGRPSLNTSWYPEAEGSCMTRMERSSRPQLLLWEQIMWNKYSVSPDVWFAVNTQPIWFSSSARGERGIEIYLNCGQNKCRSGRWKNYKRQHWTCLLLPIQGKCCWPEGKMSLLPPAVFPSDLAAF